MPRNRERERRNKQQHQQKLTQQKKIGLEQEGEQEEAFLDLERKGGEGGRGEQACSSSGQKRQIRETDWKKEKKVKKRPQGCNFPLLVVHLFFIIIPVIPSFPQPQKGSSTFSKC